ncbi:MAG: hypothetical protein DRP68_00965 [Candidatus Omnitrophota bacterium]|nr:MAG: hypothetical protein DRP68_00965 [Candidatus Omnitrophota bacterium]RKY37321.1 MAG: hypothetical protein DRP72_03280 [Candidatus Omnitrophota bacterium]RKY44601.1 MAG: hypothetical protein DRP81_05360 [Candidatus Omnitrophota bacterium]HDN85981.1 hypothetical protein [Candidatus Omnitrophota bacterium]
MNEKILIVYASCGQGHKRCAYALREALNCSCVDVLNFAPYLFKLIYSQGYRLVSGSLKWLWFFIFQITSFSVMRNLLSLFHLIIFKRFLKFLYSHSPQVVISTHFFSSNLIATSKERGRLNLKNYVVVTDFDVHPLWIAKAIDTYFVAFPETGKILEKNGVERKKIFVSGLPLRKGFFKEEDRESLKRKFFSNDKEVLLFFSSDTGQIPFLEAVLEKLKEEFSIFIIYGKNRRLEAYLRRYVNLPEVKAYSWYENIWEIMRVSLCAITKPGGLTVFEAIKVKLPLIFSSYVWGQEKYNMDFAIRYGWGFFAESLDDLIRKIYYIRDNKERIRERFPFLVRDASSLIKEYIYTKISHEEKNC